MDIVNKYRAITKTTFIKKFNNMLKGEKMESDKILN